MLNNNQTDKDSKPEYPERYVRKTYISYDDVFWRTRCVRSEWGDSVLDVCREHAYDRYVINVGGMICSIVNETWHLLDGTCSYKGGWGNGAKGVHIVGTNVERLVCYELNVEQPPLRHREETIPTFERLMEEVKTQKRLAAEGKLKRPKTFGELGLPSSIVICGNQRRENGNK